MKNTVIDAGPMIALFDRNDKFHNQVKEFISGYEGNLVSTWPVITETTHMLDFSFSAQIDFMIWIWRGAIKIFDLRRNHLERIATFSKKYSDVPMDLADASLMVAAEDEKINQIISLDSDFFVYRTIDKLYLENLLLPLDR